MSAKNKITKEATIYKRNRAFNSESFKTQRDEFIGAFLNHKPKMNVTLIITPKVF